jgi:hypothetical protein
MLFNQRWPTTTSFSQQIISQFVYQVSSKCHKYFRDNRTFERPKILIFSGNENKQLKTISLFRYGFSANTTKSLATNVLELHLWHNTLPVSTLCTLVTRRMALTETVFLYCQGIKSLYNGLWIIIQIFQTALIIKNYTIYYLMKFTILMGYSNVSICSSCTITRLVKM